MPRILRAVLKDEGTLSITVYSPDETQNSKIASEVGAIIQQALGQVAIRNEEGVPELELLRVGADDDGVLEVDAAHFLSESVGKEVVEALMRILGGEENVQEFRILNRPVGPITH